MSGFAPVKLSFGGAKLPAKAAPKPNAFGLPAKKSAPSVSASVFGQADDDDDDQPAKPPIASTSSGSGKPKVSTATLSRAQKAKQAEELLLDSTVYEYDEVYDNMKEGVRQAEQAKKKDAGDRKPKYMARLIETAEVRKRDRLRAEDKMVQREREMEGEEFADKDSFVTPAYLAQQQELRKIEEEERKKEEAAAGKAGGMTSFFKDYLDSSSKAHEAAVAASLAAPKPSSAAPSFNVVPPPPEKTEAELAAEHAAKTGQRVDVNEDGEIVDKRQLMQGGLNITAKPRAPGQQVGGFAEAISERKDTDRREGSAPRDLLSADGLTREERAKQARQRHSEMIERQMMELEQKRKRDAEEQLQHKVQKVAKRNDESKVEELKRKAEERRLKREEEARKAKEGGT